MSSTEESPGRSPVEPPPAPAAAVGFLGDRAALMQRYVDHLADTGVSHGLIGPREVPRLWERHILNCAVVSELLTQDCDVIDIGSGAGLPGVVLAIARPDLRMTLIEPLQRRVVWLERVVEDLQLSNVTVVRSRAEDQWGALSASIVTSRAVAALDKLARWSLPLLRDGGQMVALKGSSARDELDAIKSQLPRWGVAQGEVLTCGDGVVDPATIVTRLILEDDPAVGSLARPRGSGARRSKDGSGRSARKSKRHTQNSAAKQRRR